MNFCLTGQDVTIYLDILPKMLKFLQQLCSLWLHMNYMLPHHIIRWWFRWRDVLEILISVICVHFPQKQCLKQLRIMQIWSYYFTHSEVHMYIETSLLSEPRSSRVLAFFYLYLCFIIKLYVKYLEMSGHTMLGRKALHCTCPALSEDTTRWR